MNNQPADHIKEILSSFHQRHKRLDSKITFLPDSDLMLSLACEGHSQNRHINYKKTITPSSLGAIKHHMQQNTPNSILMTTHLNMSTAELLHKDDIQFMDATGNVFIHQQGLYIYENGHRPLPLHKHAAMGQFSNLTNLKIVFSILSEPRLLNATYRELSQVSNVALGAVPKVIELLKAKGYVSNHAQNDKRLNHRKKLIEQWAEAYPEKLKSKALIGIFITNEAQWWKNCNLQEYHAQWSGEVAGSLFTRDLLPFTSIIYTSNSAKLPHLLNKFRFRKLNEAPLGHEPGVLYVYESFWDPSKDFSTPNHPNAVNPILVYADLLHTGDARNLSTAKLVYDEFLT